MKSPIYHFAFALVLASCFNAQAQILHPVHKLQAANPFFLKENGNQAEWRINHSGMKLSGYAFHPIYCDSQIVEQYDTQTQGLKVTSTMKMQYDSLMRPILRKTYENPSFSTHNTTSLFFSYDTQNRVIQIQTNTSQQATYTYNGFGDLTLIKGFTRINSQWNLTHADSTVITYQNNRPFSKVSYTKDPSMPDYYAHTRNVNMVFDSNYQITQHFRQNIDWPNLHWPNHFKAEVNLEWEMGYPSNHWEYDNRPNYLGYLIALPHNWFELLPEPTKGEYYHVDGINFTLEKRLKNEGWQNNKLKIYEDHRFGSNVQIDTLYQRLYERDHLGRLIYFQVDHKVPMGTNLILWPELACRWTYDTDDRLLSTIFYENMGPQGFWLDSTVIERTYEFTSDPVPQVFRFTDSLTSNGVKRPHIRHTYFYGNFALSANTKSNAPKFQAYPNPTRDFFHLTNINAFGEHSTLRLFNAFGQLVLHNELQSANGDSQKIQLPLLPAGIYFMVLESEKGTSSKRLVIQ